MLPSPGTSNRRLPHAPMRSENQTWRRYQLHYFLSIDCGLTDSKSVLFNERGEVICKTTMATPRKGEHIHTPALQSMAVSLIRNTLKRSGVDPEDILTVSASGHGNGLYLIEQDGGCSYGYTSMYTNSRPYTPKSEQTFPYTGQSSWCGQPLAILSYIKHENPERFSKLRKILFCKDLVNYLMTGEICTDYTDASAAGLLNSETGNYDKALMAIYGLEDCMELLPRLVRCTDVIGHISPAFSEISGLSTKTRVSGGLFDVNACMIGAGVVRGDRYCIIAGTWGINSFITEERTLLREVTQCCHFTTPERYMLIDSGPTSCTNLAWFAKNVMDDMDYTEADRIVAGQPFDPELLYLPYLFCPMDMDVGGAFLGLNSQHTKDDMLRAVFEGIVFDHTYRIEKLRRAGYVSQKAVLTGGGANSAVFCQMFADCMGLEVYTTSCTQTGALGGAVIGAVIAGVYPDIETAVREMVKVKGSYKPQKNTGYPEKFERFQKAIQMFKK